VTFGAKILDPLTPLRVFGIWYGTTTNSLTAPAIPRHYGRGHPARARIIAVADAYDTITSDRTYKKARSAQTRSPSWSAAPIAEFDGAIVQVFVRTIGLCQPIIEVAVPPPAVRGS